MNDTVVVACIYCGKVFDSNTDELGFQLEDQCEACWSRDNQKDDTEDDYDPYERRAWHGDNNL